MNLFFRLVDVLLLLLAVGLSVPIVVLFVECLAAALPTRQVNWNRLLARPQIAILVPAHNEAAGIAITLKNLLPELTTGDRLVVIADNCTDDTAEIARLAGATVLERHDGERRGKGYALDFGLKALADQPPDVVVLMDADCTVGAGTIEKLARLAITRSRPVQSTYLLECPAQPRPQDAVSVLAFTVKNLVRPLGLDRLGLPCLLTGTGMAFPWFVIHKVSLASGNIVEDMQMALDLAIAGYPAAFCASAQVSGALPQQHEAAKSQRTRWEHGHLQTLLTQGPRLVRAGLRQRRVDLLTIALDLCVPPLSLLAMMLGALLLLSGVAALLGASHLPVALVAGEGLLLLGAVLLAWVKFSRTALPITTLLAVPLYILWKIPLYLKFVAKPETQWVRTERDAANPSER